MCLVTQVQQGLLDGGLVAKMAAFLPIAPPPARQGSSAGASHSGRGQAPPSLPPPLDPASPPTALNIRWATHALHQVGGLYCMGLAGLYCSRAGGLYYTDVGWLYYMWLAALYYTGGCISHQQAPC